MSVREALPENWCHDVGVKAPLLISTQAPFKDWLGLLGRMVLGAFVTAAIVTYFNFPAEAAGWSVVAVLVVVGYTAGASLVAGIQRMEGSIVGVICGAVAVAIFGNYLWIPFIVVIAVTASLSICRLIRIGTGFRLSAALSAFFVFIPGSEEVSTVGWRLAATLIGILIAMLIVMIIWPARADSQVRKAIAVRVDDSMLVVDAGFARWEGTDGPDGAADALKRIKAGTTAINASISERSHERVGAFPVATYQTLATALAEMMTAAIRLDRVAVHRDGDMQFPFVTQRYEEILGNCRIVAGHVSKLLLTDDTSDRAGMLESAKPLTSVASDIAKALEDMRGRHVTQDASAEQLQRLFSVGLLIEHWADSVHSLAVAFAES